MITIVVTHEDDQSDEFDFDPTQSTISIGRRSTNDVCIPNLSVSGRHARIVFNDGEAWIEDLNSTNGTYIKNRLISRQMLNHNDDLIVGKTRVRFENPTARKTYDAPAVEEVIEEYEEHDAFDESLPMGTINETAMETASEVPAPSAPKVAAVAAATGAAAAVTAKASSSEALFESLADDLSVPTSDPMDGDLDDSIIDAAPTPVRTEQPRAPRAELDTSNLDDEESMSLSDKAKLALGRPKATPRPTLTTVNGAAAGAATVATAAADVEAPAPKRTAKEPAAPSKQAGAVIQIKNGAKSGQILPIDKPVTTLGRPGIQIAAIMRKPDGYFLMHIESDDSVDRPTLNNDAIGDEPMLLESGDELNVAGIDVEFNLA